MGTTLTGTTPQDTYDSLIKVTDNGPISGTLKALSDGLGNDSTLSLSTTAASIAGTLAVAGAATFDTTTLVVDAANNRVGVGVASPTSTLDVAGKGIFNIGATAGDVLVCDKLAGGNIAFNINGVYSGQVGVSGLGDLVLAGRTIYPAMVITSAGVVELSQGQLKFPATQVASANANTLDDYEEGEWTMSVTFGGASVGVTTSANTGTYTKIGRQVTVNGYLELTSKGSSIGSARITGLPFSIPNLTQNYATASLYLGQTTFTNQFMGYGVVNSTTIQLDEVTILGAITPLENGDFANNSVIMINYTYFV